MLIPITLIILLSSLVVNAYHLPHIIGGREAEVGAWPWQGGIKRYGSQHCGCALIGERWAITAAHCVGEELDIYSIQFGSIDRRSGGVTIKLKTVYIHPDHGVGPGSYPNDVALIELVSPAEGANISVVKMAVKGSDHVGNTDCWITGWGYTYPGPIPILPPDILHEVQVPVLSTEDCQLDWNNKLSNDSICVGDRNKKGSCSGDSGGPLVCKVGGAYELVGVASWGIVFCWPSMPSIYAGVGYHRDWIKSVSGI